MKDLASQLKFAPEAQIGVISDTHGLVRQAALDALQGAQLIIHAGDIGEKDVLVTLENIAPVIAVRGNIDLAAWTLSLHMTEVVEASGCSILVIHDLAQLDLDPAAAGFQAVVYGHSHQPSVERRNGVLYLNPGSAGPRRFRLPTAVACLSAKQGAIEAKLVELEI
ncbi:MAG: metallophosphoesterase [Chloroflexota bacterium]|nr:MAG: metallophosphoesterase [Chloroflexota bacterium]